MPLYEYACEECEARFEELVRGEEAIVCPECGSAHLRRLFSTFATEWKPSIVNWNRFPYP
jgi:putative FmdB family regulatory protein